MSKKLDLVKNTGIIAVGKLFAQAISFLLIPLYTAYLSPSEYGVVDLIVTYIALLAPLLTIQIDRAAFRLLIESREDSDTKKDIIANSVILSLPAIALIIIAYLLLTNYINIPFACLIGLSIVVTIFSNLFMQISRGLGKNKKYAIASIIVGIFNLIFIILFVVVLKMGVQGVILSTFLSNSFGLIYCLFSLSDLRNIKLSNSSKKTRLEMVKYSLPLVPSGISWWVINVSDRTIVTVFLGVAANGIYAVANKYATIFKVFYTIFDMSWTESASIHIKSEDKDEFFSDVYNSFIRFFGFLGLILISLLPLIFGIIIGKDYAESYIYIPILIIAAFLSSMTSMYSVIYIAKKMTKKVLVTSLSAAVINILINVLLIRYIGLYAASVSTVVAYLTMSIFRGYDIKKYVNIKYNKKIIIIIALMYVSSIYLYYINNEILNIVNISFVVMVFMFMNWRLMVSLVSRVSKKLK